MKNINKYAVILFLLTGVIMSSCKKYEDGPRISFRSKTERISNTWKVESAYNDGDDVTSDFDQYELQMFDKGGASLAALYSFGSVNFEFETNGKWDLENDDKDLKLDFENDDADKTYEILKLKEKELWLKEKGGSLELHLMPR